MDKLDIFMYITVLVFIGFIGFIIYGLTENSAEKTRLINQCMADGRKEYECEAMFNAITVPYIPVTVLNR